MKEISCRCGKTKKNFKFDIGPFFIAECCEEAGFNHLGELSKEKKAKAEIEDILQEITDIGQEIELEVEDDSKKKKRQYNRSGKINIKKDT